MGMIKEFKEFALKGNMVDMAVGIIIGGAFGTIVSSLVKDVIMPPIGWLSGNIDFSKMGYVIGQDAKGADILIKYGNFMNAVIAFLIVSFVLFLLVKGMNKAKAKMMAEEEEAPKAIPNQEVLLAEIRDLLKK